MSDGLAEAVALHSCVGMSTTTGVPIGELFTYAANDALHFRCECGWHGPSHGLHLADAIRAAGWRKAPQEACTAICGDGGGVGGCGDRGCDDEHGEARKPNWLQMHHGICPKCRLYKFIGHGPLCGDCYLNDDMTTAATEETTG